ncbi:MAG: ribosome assembly RNA-binding protein YhbY [Erysipelotrichaceae bacterium]|nr:ribosome assembly RNA-binding protein YhbY [Erysipelotrichaceae bacterium]
MLSKKAKNALRGMANSLRPVVIIGKEGLSEKLYESCDVSLEAHELIKVSMLKTCPVEVKEAAIELAVNTKSEVVQIIGKTIVLYRRSHDDRNHIDLPK